MAWDILVTDDDVYCLSVFKKPSQGVVFCRGV